MINNLGSSDFVQDCRYRAHQCRCHRGSNADLTWRACSAVCSAQCCVEQRGREHKALSRNDGTKGGGAQLRIISLEASEEERETENVHAREEEELQEQPNNRAMLLQFSPFVRERN